MSTVHLTTVVLNDAEDPADLLICTRMTKYRRARTQDGRIQAVAGGGRRAVLAAGTHQEWEVSISKAPREAIDWIEDHIGRVVCLRDDAGHKVFGLYLEVEIEEVPRPRTASLDLKVAQVTWSEAD